MARKFKFDKTKELGGSPIVRSNRFFLHLKAYGHCDDNGRTVLGMSGCSKMVAPPDRALQLFRVMMDELLPGMRYSSVEAMQKDLAEFQQYVSSLTVSKGK